MSEIIIENTKDNESKRAERIAAYERFFKELQKKNITPYKVSKDTGIATATLSDWKYGTSMPKRDKIDKTINAINKYRFFITTPTFSIL